MKKIILIGLLLACFPTYAHAGLGDFLGAIVTVVAAYFTGGASLAWQAAAVAAYGIYQKDQLKKAQDDQYRRQVDAYNGSLKDRTVTAVSTEAPQMYVYGQARVGSAVVAIFASGERDEFQHLVCVHAAHECQSIDEIYIAGKPLGTLDSEGFAINSQYTVQLDTTTESPVNIFDIDVDYVSGTVRVYKRILVPDPDIGQLVQTWVESTFSQLGNTVTAEVDGEYYKAVYKATKSYVRVKKHLGSPGDPADPTLISELPLKWDSTKLLTGYCYTYIRLNLHQQEFQGGLPSIEVLLHGKKVLDPRTDTVAWSDNPALCIYDYLRSQFCAVSIEDIPASYVESCANDCDELITVGELVSVPKYTFNGTVSSGQEVPGILNQMAQAMAGGINATTWEMWAGKWVAPSLALEQEDIVGSMSVTPGPSDSDIFNGVQARFIGPDNGYVPTDASPYQNATYRASDERDLYASLEYPFTDHEQRIHNLARIFIEDQRNGFSVKGVFSLKAWDTRIGQRVTLNSAFFGFTDKVFRIVAKSYSYTGAVELTMKEDAEEIWDLADAVVLDATPNTDLPNPFVLDAPGSPVVIEELYTTTGTSGVKAKALVSWTASTSIRATGYVLEYRVFGTPDWLSIFSSSTQVEIFDIQPNTYEFRVKAVNDYFQTNANYSGLTTQEIYGLTAAPADITTFNVIAIAGRALASWDLSGDLDVRIGGRVVVRHTPITLSPSWENGIILEEFPGNSVNGNLPLVQGWYFAKFKDSSGNYSASAVSFFATESLVTGFTTTNTQTESTAFTGSKTDLVAIDGVLKLEGSSDIDSITELIDSWSSIDGAGGINMSGTYDFSTYMDFGSAVQRRIDINVEAFSYDASNVVDEWMDIDQLPSIDGGVINDTDATFYYRQTDDNPAGSPTWGEWTQFMVADVNCRAVQYRLMLSSETPTHQIEISTLSARARSSP